REREASGGCLVADARQQRERKLERDSLPCEEAVHRAILRHRGAPTAKCEDGAKQQRQANQQEVHERPRKDERTSIAVIWNLPGIQRVSLRRRVGLPSTDPLKSAHTKRSG